MTGISTKKKNSSGSPCTSFGVLVRCGLIPEERFPLTPIIRYEEAPYLLYNSPSCGNCTVDVVDCDGEWLCPTCGTLWGYDSYNERGTLTRDNLDHLPVTDEDGGWQIALDWERQERKKVLDSILNK